MHTSEFRQSNWSKNANSVKNWPTFKARPIYKRTERSDNKDNTDSLCMRLCKIKQNKLMVRRRKLEKNAVFNIIL